MSISTGLMRMIDRALRAGAEIRRGHQHGDSALSGEIKNDLALRAVESTRH
jgi:hypothetical protein